MIPKRTLTATLEISTGSMIITNRPPAFTGEAEALHVNITLLDGGIAYEPTSTIQAKLYLYWPGTVNMSEQVDLDIDENVLTGALPDTLTAVAGCPLLVIRLDDTTTGELIVAAATPIQITNVLGERVISSRPATPSEIIYVGRAPYIDETTGHWMEWDVNEGDYVDTLVPAAGSPATFTATATTLPAGSAATASITGTPQNPVLNLGIPRGADGQDSDVLSVNGQTGAVVINGSNASVSSTDDTTIAAKFGQQSDQIAEKANQATLAKVLTLNSSNVAQVGVSKGELVYFNGNLYICKSAIAYNSTVIDSSTQGTYLGNSVSGILNDLFVTDSFESTSLTVTPGYIGTVTINVAKTGYTPIGIIDIQVPNTSVFSISNFFVTNNSVVVSVFNNFDQERTSTIQINVMYRKS